jgi:hypothetical protein
MDARLLVGGGLARAVLLSECPADQDVPAPKGEYAADPPLPTCRCDQATGVMQVALLTYVARSLWAWLLELDAKSVQHPAEHHFEDPSSLRKACAVACDVDTRKSAGTRLAALLRLRTRASDAMHQVDTTRPCQSQRLSPVLTIRSAIITSPKRSCVGQGRQWHPQRTLLAKRCINSVSGDNLLVVCSGILVNISSACLSY